MPGLANAAMIAGANAIKATLLYAQLHWAAAGAVGTSNLTTAGRQSITWGPTTGTGDFGLASELDFTGGAPGSVVYSVTLWDALVSGTFGGEFLLTGDAAFNSFGEYTVSALNLHGITDPTMVLYPNVDPSSGANVRIVIPNPGKRLYPVLRTIRQVVH